MERYDYSKIDQDIKKLQTKIEYHLRTNYKNDEKYFLASHENKLNMADYVGLLKLKNKILEEEMNKIKFP